MLQSSKSIRFGHSPDPDDAFMFYAIARNKIDMKGFEVEHVIEDIESLNQRALEGELEVTAVSCHAYAHVSDKYMVMRSGASVGDNYGPILVVKKERAHEFKGLEKNPFKITGMKIAIPGKLTTAYLTLQLFEKEFETVFIPFDQILDAVEKEKVDLGLVIHEGQITYPEGGLEKVLDLGVWWKNKWNLPLPLGVDVIRRDLGNEIIQNFSQVFKGSIEYALKNRKPALDYAIEYGRGISDQINDQFVGMYVNDKTVSMDLDTEKAFTLLLKLAFEKKIVPKLVKPSFVES